jgi:hypothetical protein
MVELSLRRGFPNVLCVRGRVEQLKCGLPGIIRRDASRRARVRDGIDGISDQLGIPGRKRSFQICVPSLSGGERRLLRIRRQVERN